MVDRDEHRQLVGRGEAARYLDVSARTLEQWEYRGVGPRSYKVGHLRKYRLSDLDAWLESRASDAAPRPAA